MACWGPRNCSSPKTSCKTECAADNLITLFLIANGAYESSAACRFHTRPWVEWAEMGWAGRSAGQLPAKAHIVRCQGAGWRLRRASVASPIICRSALAMEAHRGVAWLANPLGIGRAMRLALRPDGCAQPTTSDRWRDTGSAGMNANGWCMCIVSNRCHRMPWGRGCALRHRPVEGVEGAMPLPNL